MSESPILSERIGRVGVLTLNRPQQLNALNDALMDALGAALLAFDADDGVGAIVITGGPKAFARAGHRGGRLELHGRTARTSSRATGKPSCRGASP
jgi:enoyl-CoA hydratase